MRTLRRFRDYFKSEVYLFLLKSFFFVHRKEEKLRFLVAFVVSLHRLVAVVIPGLVLLAFARVDFLVDGHGPNLIRLAVKQGVAVVDERLPVLAVR